MITSMITPMIGTAAALTMLLFANQAKADDTCTCASADGAFAETVLDASTSDGRSLTLRFAVNPVTTSTKKAFLCTSPSAPVSMAKLWMPDMGHGSAPTRLTAANENCTVVERINFLMEGDWQILVTLGDGDTGVFSLPVTEE